MQGALLVMLLVELRRVEEADLRGEERDEEHGEAREDEREVAQHGGRFFCAQPYREGRPSPARFLAALARAPFEMPHFFNSRRMVGRFQSFVPLLFPTCINADRSCSY